MARWLALAASALLLAVPGFAQPRPGEPGAPPVRDSGDWTVACDNVGDCVAVSVSRAFVRRIEQADPGDLARPKLWVRRLAGPDGPVRVLLDTRVWGEAPAHAVPAMAISMECDFDCITRAYPLTMLEPGLYELAAAEVVDFLIDTTYGQRAVTRYADGTEHGIVSTDGLAEALRWIDDSQHRSGTVTATIIYGELPATTVPPRRTQPVVPVVRARDEGEIALAAYPALATAQSRFCDATDSDDLIPVQKFALDSGQRLWSVGCGSTPFAEVRLWLVETGSAEFTLHLLPRPDAWLADQQPVLGNSSYDPASGMLTSYSGGMCGWQRRWAWTGDEFAMIDAIAMPACLDILPGNWLQTYRAIPQ